MSSPAPTDSSLSAPVRQTADKISSSRALLSQRYPSFLYDPYAKFFGQINETRPTSSLSRIAVRTRVFDNFVESAVSRNYTQFLSLGAGYDFRFLRVRLPSNIRVYEIDQAEVIQRKVDGIRVNGIKDDERITRIPADLTSSTWLSTLKSSTTFNPNLPTCIIAEGLLYYFTPSTAKKLIQECREICNDRVCGIFSAVSEGAVGGMGGLFRWGSDTVENDFKSCGWEHCTALTLGSPEFGCDCFNDYLKSINEYQPSINNNINNNTEVMSETSGALEGRKTFYVVCHENEEKHECYKPIVWSEGGEGIDKSDNKSDNKSDTVIICLGKKLVNNEITNELKGRILRAASLNATLPNSTIIFSGGLDESSKMLEYAHSTFGSSACKKVILESKSTTTRENAIHVLNIFKEFKEKKGWKNVYIVTSSYHSNRAVRVFTETLQQGGFNDLNVKAHSNFFAVPHEASLNEDHHFTFL